MIDTLKIISLDQQKQYRIIPSVFPAINFFEEFVDNAAEMETLIEIESLTNPRIRQEVGEIFLVPVEDRVKGPGSSVVMASFTHIYRPSRFSDGSYGVYYAGLTLETAIKETVFYRENFLRATHELAGEITMRVYEGTIVKPLHDIRYPLFQSLHDPDNYTQSQQFGKKLKEEKSWGVIYHSVRHPGNHCIAAFRPPTISIPQQTSHLKYYWNGKKISAVYDVKSVMGFN